MHCSAYTKNIPNTDQPNNAAFVLWTDLNPAHEGITQASIFTWANATVAVVEWNTPHYQSQVGDVNAQFQLVLLKDSNSARFQYKDHERSRYPSWAPVSVGVEDASGTHGVEVSYADPDFPPAASAIHFSRQCLGS